MSQMDYDKLYEDTLNSCFNRSGSLYSKSWGLNGDQKRWMDYFIRLEAPETVDYLYLYYSPDVGKDIATYRLGIKGWEGELLLLRGRLAVADNIPVIKKAPFIDVKSRVSRGMYHLVSISELVPVGSVRESSRIFRMSNVRTLKDLLGVRDVRRIRGMSSELACYVAGVLRELGT